MPTLSYQARRAELETYFDRTAAETWARLTSDAPVSRIRATVRAGRNTMRETLLGWLPADLSGCRVLDAGCGTGALAVEVARRGAEVVAVDLAGSLLDTARERLPRGLAGRVEFVSGDMLSGAWGRFDYTVAMDSLIHYRLPDVVNAVAELSANTRRAVLVTFAPRTPLLTVAHAVGRLFPRGDRAPAIVPLDERRLVAALADVPSLAPTQTRRVASGFYTSQALEVIVR